MTGVVSGILFSGLFFKLIRNLFTTVSFEMYFPIAPVMITVILFLGMFLVISFITPYFISHKKVLWFLKSDKSYAEDMKLSVKNIFGAILLLAMTIVLMIPQIGNRLGDFWTPLVFVCVAGFIFLATPQVGAIYSGIRKCSKKSFRRNQPFCRFGNFYYIERKQTHDVVECHIIDDVFSGNLCARFNAE